LLAFAPILLKGALLALAFLAIVAVVEDLINLFTGGESVIGDFIDEMFGVGTSQKVVEDLKAAWQAFTAFLEDPLLPIAKQVFGFILGIVGDLLGSVFGVVKGVFGLIDALTKAQSAGDVFRAVFEFVADNLLRVIELVGSLIGKFLRLSTVGSKIAGFLGLGSTQEEADEAAASRRESVSGMADSLFGPQQATTPVPASTEGMAGVQQANEYNFNISSSDPRAAASEVQRRQRGAQQRTARDLEAGLAQGAA
ncbi:MAG: hypothetical protein ACOC9T_03560, partial [Myxococcota bacterium]